jgi:hypothetical protein
VRGAARLSRLDPFDLRRFVPRALLRKREPDEAAAAAIATKYSVDEYRANAAVDESLDLLAVCYRRSS